MAKDRDNEGAVAPSQSKRPQFNRLYSDSQLLSGASDAHQLQQQHYHPRPKATKHVVGGGRLHGRVPSSKTLHKHHATTSTNKLIRRASSPSPERKSTSSHRRSTSDVKLARDPSSSNLKKNASQTQLHQHRSNLTIGKKSKSTTNLTRNRSTTNISEHKKTPSTSKVHFDIGDEEEEEVVEPEDEWVDASNSASPHLSRRSSVAQSHPPLSSSNLGKIENASHETDSDSEKHEEQHEGPSSEPSIEPATPSDPTGLNLTKRLLQRVPSQGTVIPPAMVSETVSARPPRSRQDSPEPGRDLPRAPANRRVQDELHPGSSGREELTSRFVVASSQLPSSGLPGESFLDRPRPARAPSNSKAEDNGIPRRPKSMVNLGQAQSDRQNGSRTSPPPTKPDSDLTDEEDGGGLIAGHTRRTGMARNANRTQQKLNLQRASSTLEGGPAHSVGLTGLPVSSGSMMSNGYGSGDPRLGKALERTGMEYLVVRRYQNPVARSLARLSQLPGANRSRPITRPGTAHSRADSGHFTRPASINGDPRDPHMAALMHAQGTHSTRHSRQNGSRANGPAAGFESEGLHETSRLSGSSLVDGEEDAGTVALLRNMWDKNIDLSASQE